MRKRIVDTAAHQMMRVGFRKATMDEIASALGVSKKTIYKHFSSKRSLVVAVIEQIIAEDLNSTITALDSSASWLDKLDAMMFSSKYAAPARLVAEIKCYYPEQWKKVEEFKDYKVQQFHQLLQEGASKGEINPDIQLEVAAIILEKTLDELLEPQFINNHDLTIKQIIEQITGLFLYGIVKRA